MKCRREKRKERGAKIRAGELYRERKRKREREREREREKEKEKEGKRGEGKKEREEKERRKERSGEWEEEKSKQMGKNGLTLNTTKAWPRIFIVFKATTSNIAPY